MNVWTDHPKDVDSGAMIARLVSEAQHPRSSINYGGARTIYVVPPEQSRVPVELVNLADPALAAMLADGVPIPAGAWGTIKHKPDRSLIVQQGATEWELWEAARDDTGAWSCKNAGCVLDYTYDSGFFNPLSWANGRLHSNFGWGHRSWFAEPAARAA